MSLIHAVALLHLRALVQEVLGVLQALLIATAAVNLHAPARLDLSVQLPLDLGALVPLRVRQQTALLLGLRLGVNDLVQVLEGRSAAELGELVCAVFAVEKVAVLTLLVQVHGGLGQAQPGVHVVVVVEVQIDQAHIVHALYCLAELGGLHYLAEVAVVCEGV